MKDLFVKLLMTILKNLNVTVLLNVRIEKGKVQFKKNNVFLFDNHLHEDVEFILSDERPVKIPDGKFQMKINGVSKCKNQI